MRYGQLNSFVASTLQALSCILSDVNHLKNLRMFLRCQEGPKRQTSKTRSMQHIKRNQIDRPPLYRNAEGEDGRWKRLVRGKIHLSQCNRAILRIRGTEEI